MRGPTFYRSKRKRGELYYQLLKRRKKTATASKYTKRKQLQLERILYMFGVIIFFFFHQRVNSQVTRIIAQKNCKKKIQRFEALNIRIPNLLLTVEDAYQIQRNEEYFHSIYF